MTKTRAWPVKVMYMLIAAALAISLIIIAAPTQRVNASPDLSEWSEVSTPSQDGVVLAPDSTIIDYAIGAAGEVAYAIFEGEVLKEGDPEDGIWLLKSDNYAATWDDLNDALDDVIDPDDEDFNYIDELLLVACDAEDPDFVAVALWWYSYSEGYWYLSVFFSTDGGTTFEDADEVEDGGVYLDYAYDLEVSPEASGKRDIAIGGVDDSDDAALFRSTVTGDTAGAWEDATAYDGWDNQWPGDVNTDDIYSEFVTDIIFSTKWTTDKTILVTTVADDYYGDQGVYLQCGSWGTSEGWNEKSTLGIEAVPIKEDVSLPTSVLDCHARAVAGIALPEDYNSKNTDDRVLWVWVNYYDDEGYPACEINRVENDSADPVGPMGQIEDGEIWLTNVSYQGTILEGEAIAGVLGDGYGQDEECCVGVQVYRNDGIRDMDICCERWAKACKPPTGIYAMAVSYVGEDKAYAVALCHSSYDEGAWSVTFDDGDTWNQLSLIDTYIDHLSDVAVSPDCNKTMLASVNLASGCCCDSVWLHADNLPEADEYNGRWLRTWCGQLEGNYPYGEHGMLRLAPEEDNGDTVYLVDRGTGNVYSNSLETLWCWDSIASTAVDTIVDLAVKEKDTLYALDVTGDVTMFSEDEWQEAVDSEVDDGWTIAVWGDDILVGGQNGDVSHSEDGGENFTVLEEIPKIGGYVTVAFDSYFDTNGTIYAAVIEQCPSVPGDNGVYRWILGEDDKWYDLGAEPSTFQLTGSGSKTDTNKVGYTGLVLDNADGNPRSGADTGGVLYASYVTEIDGEIVTGVARHLTPAEDVVCKECGDWDYLIVGLTPDKEAFYMMPKALKICGCLTANSNSHLFAIDGIYGTDGPGYDMEEAEDGTVWTFEDCYAKAAPDLTGPEDGATIASDPCACVNVGFNIKWDRQCDACRYDIQIALDEDFTEIISLPASAEDTTDYLPAEAATPGYYIPKAALDCEVTYYWRVRSAEAETGQVIHSWWSDPPRSFTIAPGPDAGTTIGAPESGATNVAITNVGFTWGEVATADTYDFVLSANPDLSSPIETKTGLTTTACTYTGTLDYDTTYFWQVIAYKEGSVIDKSVIATFATVAAGQFCCPQCGLCFDTQAELEAHLADAHPAQPPTPTWVWVVIAIGAVLVIVVIVLIFRTRRV